MEKDQQPKRTPSGDRPAGARNQSDDPKRPSQAEGDRETVDQALERQDGAGQRKRGERSSSDRSDDPQRPSQAEGDRETVEQDLRERSTS